MIERHETASARTASPNRIQAIGRRASSERGASPSQGSESAAHDAERTGFATPEDGPDVDPVKDGDDAPPDGGFTAWMQVAAAFALYFNHLGLINSYGVFQTYYERALLSTSSPSSISWIGSVQIFLLLGLSVVVGPLYDAGHCRALVAAGALLVTLGMALVSVADRYWHVLLAQGVCVGLGACCLQVPSIAVVAGYFRRRRARAMALATVGSGLGSTLYPLVFTRLEASVGFAWAVRVMALMCLVLCVFAFIVIRPRPRPLPPPPAPPSSADQANLPLASLPAPANRFLSVGFFIDASAFRDRPYLLFCAGVFFSNLCFFQATYYVQSYALAHGMARAPLARYLLAILNASSIPGRVVSSFIADRLLGPLHTYAAVCGLTAASVFYWVSVSNAAGNVAFSVLYGFFSGGVVALAAVVLTDVTPDMRRLGARIGMVSILKGVGSLIGPPLAGVILDAEGSYLGVQLFAGFGFTLTTAFAVALSLLVARRKRSRAEQLAVERGSGPNRSVMVTDAKEGLS